MAQTQTLPAGYRLYTHDVYRSGERGEPYQIAANLTEASAMIYIFDEDEGLVPTPLQSAHASCRVTDLRTLVASWIQGE